MAPRALVVGGTSGIGYAMACRVAASSPSASVVISGRTRPDNMPHANMEFRPIEATSMREIKSFTDGFKHQSAPEATQNHRVAINENNKLDLLIMTQGIMTMAGRTETPEGIDRKMALHYYGKQLLIRELMPSLKEDAKVVIVYDSWSGNMNKLNWDDLDLKTHFSLGTAANHCQVMSDIMIQHYAAQQGTGTTARRHFIHAWPGGVNTEGLMREMPWVFGAAAKLLAPLVTVTPAKCAEYLLDGIDKVAAGDKEGRRFWACIDNKGRVLENKPVCTEEQMGKIADHTWKLIDTALKA